MRRGDDRKVGKRQDDRVGGDGKKWFIILYGSSVDVIYPYGMLHSANIPPL